MFQHEYEPGYWSKLADYLPVVLILSLVGGAIFAGFSRSFWGWVICIINIIITLGIAALYWRYKSEEADIEAGRKGRL
jgi:hypothetical protein